MSKKTIIGIIILLAAAAAGIVVFALMQNKKYENPTAEIYQNGVLIRTMPLDKPARFTAECPEGKNEIVVENGKIRVESADCPDKVCVNMGAINGAVPIVCLPHRLEIRVVNGADEIDAKT